MKRARIEVVELWAIKWTGDSLSNKGAFLNERKRNEEMEMDRASEKEGYWQAKRREGERKRESELVRAK